MPIRAILNILYYVVIVTAIVVFVSFLFGVSSPYELPALSATKGQRVGFSFTCLVLFLPCLTISEVYERDPERANRNLFINMLLGV